MKASNWYQTNRRGTPIKRDAKLLGVVHGTDEQNHRVRRIYIRGAGESLCLELTADEAQQLVQMLETRGAVACVPEPLPAQAQPGKPKPAN